MATRYESKLKCKCSECGFEQILATRDPSTGEWEFSEPPIKKHFADSEAHEGMIRWQPICGECNGKKVDVVGS